MTHHSIPITVSDLARGVLPTDLRLGAVRLAVTDLARSVPFYTRVLGLEEIAREHADGRAVVHLGLRGEDIVVLQEERAALRSGRHAGLFHIAYNFPSRLELARALRRISESRISIEGASDHQTHDAIYLPDPDGNGVELAWDHPREQWPSALVRPLPLDLEQLLALTAGEPTAPRAEDGLRVGHVHLHVGDVARALAFYVGVLGFELQDDMGTAAFVSAGDYHHHLGVNVWQGPNAPPPPADAVGLREWRIYLPTADDVAKVHKRVVAAGAPAELDADGAVATADPWGIPLRVAVDPRAR